MFQNPNSKISLFTVAFLIFMHQKAGESFNFYTSLSYKLEIGNLHLLRDPLSLMSSLYCLKSLVIFLKRICVINKVYNSACLQFPTKNKVIDPLSFMYRITRDGRAFLKCFRFPRSSILPSYSCVPILNFFSRSKVCTLAFQILFRVPVSCSSTEKNSRY